MRTLRRATAVIGIALNRELLDDLAMVADVDADRVFATGLSNGGIMARYLASALSDRIAAMDISANDLNHCATNRRT